MAADTIPVYGIYLTTNTESSSNIGNANYATGPGVSISSVGGLNTTGLGANSTLVTTPASMPLGLTSGTLSLSSTSDTASSSGGADLANGTLHAGANSNGAISYCGTLSCTTTGLNAIGQGYFVDTLTFSTAGTEFVTIHVDGTASSLGTSAANYGYQTQFAFGGYGFGTEYNSNGIPFAVLVNPYAPTSLNGALFTNESGLGYDFTGSINVTAGEQLVLDMNLYVTSGGGVNADFTNTDAITLSGPSFTSASGIFLTQGQGPSPVPEPSSVVLLGTMLAAAAGIYLRRSRARLS